MFDRLRAGYEPKQLILYEEDEAENGAKIKL